VPPLTGGTRQKCGAHNVLTVILAIVNKKKENLGLSQITQQKTTYM